MEVDESDKHSNLLQYILNYGGNFFIVQAPEWHKLYNFSQPLLIPISNKLDRLSLSDTSTLWARLAGLHPKDALTLD
jgi:hypothetical protein